MRGTGSYVISTGIWPKMSSTSFVIFPYRNFAIFEAYDTIKSTARVGVYNWKWIWKSPMIPKIKFFVWLLCHNKIASKELLFLRNITLDNLCPICCQDVEDIDHIFCRCSPAFRIWHAFSSTFSFSHSFNMDFVDWIHINCKNRTLTIHQIPWCVVFPFLLSAICK